MSSSGALFGSSAGSGGAGGRGGGGGSKNLVEFRAGKMSLKDKLVTPDKRKGLLYIYQADDGLMHLCWKERSKGTAEDDLIIFPDDFEYKVIPQCTTGRAYVLKFKSSPKKMFFWMQEPKTDKDEEYCRKLNDSLQNPPVPGSNRGGGGGGLPADLAGISGDNELQSLLSSMNQQQLMQILGNMGGMSGLSSLMGGRSSSSFSTDSTTPSVISSSHASVPPLRPYTASGALASSTTSTAVSSSSGTTSSSTLPSSSTTRTSVDTSGMPVTSSGSVATSGGAGTQRIQLSDLQNILSGFSAMDTAGPIGGTSSASVDLSDSLSAELLIPILANPDVQARLVPFLPEGTDAAGVLTKTEDELRQTVHSPQFQQALQSFSAAFSSCQLGPLIAQFGLGDDAVQAAAVGDVPAFAKALQESAAKKKTTTVTPDASSAQNPSAADEKGNSVKEAADKDDDKPADMEQD